MAKPIPVKSSLSSCCVVGPIPTTYRSSGHAGFLVALHQACVESVFILHCWGSDCGCAQRIAEPFQTSHCLSFLLINYMSAEFQAGSQLHTRRRGLHKPQATLSLLYENYVSLIHSHLETTFLSLGLS